MPSGWFGVAIGMLYDAYQAQSDLLAPLRAIATITQAAFGETQMGPAFNYFFKGIAAGAEIASRAQLSHDRPPYEIREALVEGRTVPVLEEKALESPFGTLLHFRKETNLHQPRVLIVAPMAGHFATLLRHTARTMLNDHDVYITDWKSARDVPLAEGRFGVDDYIDTLIGFLDKIGPGAHTVAVCQPCAALLAAVSIMAETSHRATPRSMTLMAGPVDTSVNPTEVNRAANKKPIEWFEKNLISTVPERYAGAGRRVYPGFLQISAFMSMNLPRHWRAHMDLYGHILRGDEKKATANKKFYDEYLAVSDLSADFFLETVQKVFQEYHLPRGLFQYRGNPVSPAAIRKTALLTVEGEKDDICSVGQTVAAHDLTPGIKPFKKMHYVQAGVGHYGVFSGTRWATQIYPMVRSSIQAND
jgi:poly(3-hydroxybutyrate) depolymerase